MQFCSFLTKKLRHLQKVSNFNLDKIMNTHFVNITNHFRGKKKLDVFTFFYLHKLHFCFLNSEESWHVNREVSPQTAEKTVDCGYYTVSHYSYSKLSQRKRVYMQGTHASFRIGYVSANSRKREAEKCLKLLFNIDWTSFLQQIGKVYKQMPAFHTR